MAEQKRIFVVSDTHGNISGAIKAIEREKKNGVAEIWHLGDHAADAEVISERTGIPAVSVRGNCDYAAYGSELYKVVTVCGRKVFLTHGHGYGVGYSLMRLSLAAEEAGAELALFGHTHVPSMDFVGRLIIMNPGSISSPRMGSRHSYGILRISADGIYPELKSLED